MTRERAIAPLDAVPRDGSLLFRFERDGEPREAILVRTAEGPRAYENYCRHWTDVRLDDGDGATLRGEEVLCERHGASFHLDDGACTHGPCEGAVLPALDVTVVDGDVHLVEDDCTYLGRGPVAGEGTDDDGPGDDHRDGDVDGASASTAGSRIGFGGV